MKVKPTIRSTPEEGKALERPLAVLDPPHPVPAITQSEIVAFATALYVFRLARADFEAKRAGLTVKLLRCCHCEDGHYFTLLDERGEIVIEDRTSKEVGTGRPILDRDSVPAGGAA
jgi:hypothetical protein